MPRVQALVVSSFIDVHGLRMHSRRTVGAAPGSAPVLVLVHGVGMSSRYMMPLAKQLADDFHVYAVDLPGNGRSQSPDHALALSAMADVLDGWLEAMQLQPAALLGNSFGCQMIVELALRHPQRVRRAVLQGPTVEPAAGSIPRLLLRALAGGWWERWSLLWVMFRDYSACGPVRWIKTLRTAIEDPVESKLPRLDIPVLVVRGEHDAIVSQGWSERITRLLPQGRLVVIPRAAHGIVYGQPQELAAVVTRFLAGDGDEASRQQQ